MLVSDRGIELVTQKHDKKYLTVEESSKWYNLYIINTDGCVSKLDWGCKSSVLDMLYNGSWCDHCINPLAFVKITEILNLSYDEDTLNAVLDMWLENYLEGDVVKILQYIPSGHRYITRMSI